MAKKTQRAGSDKPATKKLSKRPAIEASASYSVPQGQDSSRVPMAAVAQLVKQAAHQGFRKGVDATITKHRQTRGVSGAERPAAPRQMPMPPVRAQAPSPLARIMAESAAQQRGGLVQVAAALQGRQPGLMGRPAVAPPQPPVMTNRAALLRKSPAEVAQLIRRAQSRRPAH